MTTSIKEWRIYWCAWPKGARIPNWGTVHEYGKNEQEARERVLQRFPDIDRIEYIEEVPATNKS